MRTEAATPTTMAKRTKTTNRASTENMIGGPFSDWSPPASDETAQPTRGVVKAEAGGGFSALRLEIATGVDDEAVSDSTHVDHAS
jgi:hypothetical protein